MRGLVAGINLNRIKPVAGAVMIIFSLALSGFSAARVLSAPLATAATVPDRVGFEGFLIDEGTGEPLDGSYDLTFRVYSAPTEGTALWTEEHEGVAVTDGLYAVELGGGTAFGANTFDGDRWIGVQVGTGEELTPRTKVSSVPFALNAQSAQTADSAQSADYALAADTVDGKDAADLQVPVGGIIMWSGTIGSIPDGWALCDGGTHSGVTTPDLRNRFVVGAGAAYNPGDKGGEATMAHTHSVDLPNYSGTSSSVGNHRHWADPPAVNSSGGQYWGAGGWSSSSHVGEGSQHHNHTVDVGGFNTHWAGGHNHTINHNHPAATSGGASNTENRPPYYALAFIIKVEE